MKRITVIFLMTVFAIFTQAQKVYMVFNSGGTPEELTLVDSNGVKIGYSNFYSKTGTLTMSLMYKNGVPNGQWTRYDEQTGKLKESFTYVNGKLNGEHFWYDESGNILKCIVHKNGIRINNLQAENLWALEVVPQVDATSSFRFMSVSPTQSFVNYCAVSSIV